MATAVKGKAKESKSERLKTELIKLFWTFLYLFILFGSLVLFRAVLLKHEGINIEMRYGFAALNALIFAKVVLIGDWIGVGKRVDGRPLLWSVLFKAVAFGALFVFFHFLEEGIGGLFHGKPWGSGVAEAIAEYRTALVSALLFSVALVPFFALREMTHVLGSARTRMLLLDEDGVEKVLGVSSAR